MQRPALRAAADADHWAMTLTTGDTGMQDVFICHSSKDKDEYVRPLARAFDEAGVSYWLDEQAVSWGDSLALKINAGLRDCRFVLLCLSERFLQSNCAQAEMNAILSVQSSSGQKRVLPLILDGKSRVLDAYPLLAGLAYQEFRSTTPASIAALIHGLAEADSRRKESIHLHVEGKNTGQVYDFTVPSTCTIRYLLHEVRQALKLRQDLETGSIEPFMIRWVLVGKSAIQFWNQMPRPNRQEAFLVSSNDGTVPSVSMSDLDRVGDYVRTGSVFYLCPVEDTTVQTARDAVPMGAFH